MMEEEAVTPSYLSILRSFILKEEADPVERSAGSRVA